MSYLGTIEIGKMCLGSVEIGSAYLGNKLVYQTGGGGGLLPSGYIMIEYVQGAVTPINTNIGVFGSRWELVLQEPSVPSANQICACYDAVNGKYVAALSNGKWGMSAYYNIFSQTPCTDKSTLIIQWSNAGILTLEVNNETITWRDTLTPDNSKMSLLGAPSGTPYLFTGKVYSIKCLSGGDFDGVPAQDINTGKQGLYDIANNVFYPLT